MKAALFVALSLLALVSLVAAAPNAFVGGSFYQAAGLHVNSFAVFDVDSNEWSPAWIPSVAGDINSMAAAGDGVFIVGSFSSVGGSTSSGVAFWDGNKLCPIRQGLSGGAARGDAVVCDSATSCWVAGQFTSITNVESTSAAAVNFAHYVFNTASNEWEFDLTQTRWNNATVGDTLPDGIAVDKLDYVGSGANLFFFVMVGNTIYRGGAADDGWFIFSSATSQAGTIQDWSIDPSRSTMYAVVAAGNNALQSVTGVLTSACAGSPCTQPIAATSDWTAVITGGYNGSIFNSFDRVHAISGARFLIGSYDPDSSETEFVARYRVLRQEGATVPGPVGDAFEVSTSNNFQKLLASESDAALVVGSFEGANLFYPTDPVTTDSDGVVSDRRSLDRVSGLAVFNSTLDRWVQWGAGGISGGASSLAYNSNTREWFVAGSFSFAYNLHADGAMYHDDDSGLTDPFFPIFTRYLQTRPIDDGEVWEMICETSACSAVFVGGDFAFHGPDTFGAVVRAVVKRSGDPELTAVGGGLWNSDDAGYLEDEAFQLSNGRVYALTITDGFLYAGGAFSRTAPSNGFLCLGNIARIDASALSGNWENLGGGCDDEVYDITEWFGRIYAAGRFRKCGDAIVNYVAAYTFRANEPAWESLHTGVDATAYSLEPFRGRLIVGGDFTHAGGLPVSGVASWDGFKWRALLPACTGDCTPGNLQFYYNVVNSPSSVHDLQRDRSGRYLFATGQYEMAGRFLSRWEYTDGDFGRWLVKGEIDYDSNHDGKGHNVAIFTNDKLLIAGDANTDPFDDANDELGVWDQNAENSNVTPSLTGDDVRVVRGPAGGNAGSASTLSSPLSSLLAFVF